MGYSSQTSKSSVTLSCLKKEDQEAILGSARTSPSSFAARILKIAGIQLFVFYTTFYSFRKLFNLMTPR
jgi:hypothetical protein